MGSAQAARCGHCAANRRRPSPGPAVSEPGDAGLGLVEGLLARGEGKAGMSVQRLPSAVAVRFAAELLEPERAVVANEDVDAALVELVFEGREDLVGHAGQRLVR